MIPYDLGLVYSSNVVTASIITNLIEPSVDVYKRQLYIMSAETK